MATTRRLPAGRDIAAFVPAAVGLALLIVVTELRMDDPWAEGVLFLVAVVPAALLIAVGLGAREAPRAALTVVLVAGLVLAAVAIGRLGNWLGGDDFTAAGGTLTWMLLLFAGLAAFCYDRSRAVACLLLAALAAVGLFLEAVNWIFGIEDVDTFRVLLILAFAVLFGAGLAVAGRAGTILVAAAGVTVLAASQVLGGGLFFFDAAGLGWGWELVLLLQGVALVAYAATNLEPGPGYLAFFVFAVFVTTVAAGGAVEGGVLGDQSAPSDASLVGWPLALALATVAATLWGLRQTKQASRYG